MTGFVVIALGVVAYNLKTDVLSSKFYSYLMLIMFLKVLFGWIFFSFDSIIYSVLGSVAVCTYLIIDLQLLMGNKKFQFSLDDHCFAAIQIYGDIIAIFLKVLEFL